MKPDILDDKLFDPLVVYEDKNLPEMHDLPRYILIFSLFPFATDRGLGLTLFIAILGLVVYILMFQLSKTSFKLYSYKLVVYNYYFQRKSHTLDLNQIAEVEHDFGADPNKETFALRLKPNHGFKSVKEGKSDYYLEFEKHQDKVSKEMVMDVFRQNKIPMMDFWDKKLNESMGENWREKFR